MGGYASSLHAATYTRDPSQNTTGSDGGGAWDNSATNWASGGVDTAFLTSAQNAQTTTTVNPVIGQPTLPSQAPPALSSGKCFPARRLQSEPPLLASLAMSSRSVPTPPPPRGGSVFFSINDAAVIGSGTGAAGTITVTGDSLTLNAAGSGTYSLTGESITVGSRNGGGAITVNADTNIGSNLAWKNTVFATSGKTLTLSSGGITSSTGGGTLTLSGANTYTKGTTVSAGTLATSTTGAFGTGDVTVADGATLILGNSALIGDLADLVFGTTGGTTINRSFTGTETINTLNSIAGQFASAGTNYDATALNGIFGGTFFTGLGLVTITSAPIPEPTTYAAIFGALALGGAVCLRRRRAASNTV